jgi:hypothetical protein
MANSRDRTAESVARFGPLRRVDKNPSLEDMHQAHASLQSMAKHMSFTPTRALITHSWTHITLVDTMLRQTSCHGREL